MQRWVRLSHLVTECERLFEANARLDAHERQDGARLHARERYEETAQARERACEGAAIGRRLTRLANQVDHELDMLTSATLNAQLVRLKARA